MEKPYTSKKASAKAKSYQSQIDKYLQEIRRLQNNTNSDQNEINQLREETRRNLNEIKKIITSQFEDSLFVLA